MEFGMQIGCDPRTTAREARLLEERGFSSIWFANLPTIGWGDPYIAMAQAAEATQRIRVVSFVPSGMRVTPEVVNAHATINRIAPGRVVMGYLSGSISRWLIGLPPLKIADLHEELSVIRSLLDEREAVYNGQRIRFHQWPRPSTNLDDPIAIYIAASGPRTAALVGTHGHGLVTGGEIRPEELRILRDAALASAEAAGRPFATLPFVVDIGPLCLQRPGEPLDSERIVAAVQPGISGGFGVRALAGQPPDEVEPGAQDDYARYLDWVQERFGDDPDARMFGLIERFTGRQPEHDQFISPSTIRACTITGPLEEVAERLLAIEQAGATHVTSVRAFDKPVEDDEELADMVALMERVG